MTSGDQGRLGELPQGTVTFLFTDIEGSTRLLQEQGSGYQAILERHAQLMREAIAAHAGDEVATEGDSFFAVFPSATDAVAAAVEAQRALTEATWPPGATLRVRMGLHTGAGTLGGDNYIGLDVHRAARIEAAAHGGQVLISDTTRSLVAHELPDGASLADLGMYRLRDIETPQHLYRVRVPAIPDNDAPPRSHRLGNLPAPPTRFIGRDRERAEVRAQLEDSHLVTLVGPAGAGKTRLAIEVASEVAGGFADGAFFVPLEAVSEPRLLPAAVGSALGLTEVIGVDPLDGLSVVIADRRMLLLLDNFEQILAAASAVARLVEAAADLRVIVTSRAPLKLYGEQLYPVPALAAPGTATEADPEDLARYESVALFVDRARAVQPGFALTADNAAAVATICAHLDGLPLAVELAAARVRLLPPAAIVKRLGSRLDMLASTAPNIPERQRTLRGAIDWSYELLDEPVRHLLDRLSVFAGGCGFEAAEAVCDPDGELGVDLLDALGQLVDSSLVQQRASGGEPRFDLLETIDDFAAERLEQRGEAAEVRRRHADWYVAFIEAASDFLDLPVDSARQIAIRDEHDNLRAAIRSSLEDGRPEAAQRIVAVTWHWWQQRGLYSEGRWWADLVVSHPAAQARTAGRASALGALGSIAYWQGDQPAMAAAYEESLDIAHELGDAAGIARATYNLSFVPAMTGDRAASRELLEEALTRFRDVGDPAGIGETLVMIGYADLQNGDLQAARRAFEEVRGLAAPEWIRRWASVGGLARVAWAEGDIDTALARGRESIRVVGSSRDLGRLAGGLDTIAALEVEAGATEKGIRLHGAALALRDLIGGGPPTRLFIPDVWDAARATVGGPERYEQLLSEGRALELEAAVELAASDTPPDLGTG